MSTTGGTPQGTVGLLDPPDTIRRKVRSAVTDSGSDVRRGDDKPGITNLIDIMSVATGATPEEIEATYDGSGYGKFKEDVAESVVALLDPIRLRYGEVRSNQAVLRAILAEGAAKAELIAAETLEVAYERVGFVAP
jgi:tryptophanyl-tRNA synthetase